MGQLQKVSWRTVGYTALGTVLAAASVVAVVNSDGVRPTALSANAATRWLVDRAHGTVVLVDGLAGNVLAKITTDTQLEDEVAVQGTGGAFLIAKRQGSIRTISTAKLQLGTAQPVALLTEESVQFGVGASGLTVVSPTTSEARVVAVDDVSRGIKVPEARDAMVAADGSMWLISQTTATHVNVDQTSASTPLRSLPNQQTTVGSKGVAYDQANGVVRWLDGTDVDISSLLANPSEALMQEPSDDAPCVWIGNGDTMLCVSRTGVDRTVTVAGLNLSSAVGDKLAVAGSTAVWVTSDNRVRRIDLENQTLPDDEVRPSVPDGAGPLAITASNNLIWLDNEAGEQAWVVQRFGINVIDKNAPAPTVNAQGQVQDAGDGPEASPTPGGGDSSGEEAEHEIDNNGVDDPPVAVEDSVTARAGTTITIPVLGNDYDPDGNAIAVVEADTQAATHGATDVFDGTSVTYRPEFGYSGSDEFKYTITDENGNHASAFVHIELFPPDSPNRPPIARNDRVKTRLDRPVIIDVLANDIDPERDMLTVSAFQSAGLAKITDAKGPTGLPALLYTPPPGRPGTYTFTYQAVDPQGGTSAKTTVTVDVSAAGSENTLPVAGSDAVRLSVGTPGTIDVKANDTDEDGDELTISYDDNVRGVTAEVVGQRLKVTLLPGAPELSVIHYTLTDEVPTTRVPGKVLVVRLPDESPNRPPVANADSDRVVIGNSVRIAVTANDGDPDQDVVRLLSVEQPADGVGTTTQEGNFVRFKPNLPDITESTPVKFTYRISDGHGNEAIGNVTVTVLVEALPRAPFAADDFADTVTNKPVTIDVLANDSDPSGGQPSLVGDPICATGGVAVRTPEDRVTFTPPTAATGTFKCKYTVTNGQGLQAEASIIITVAAAQKGNGAPFMDPLQIRQTVFVGQKLTLTADLVANDPDGDPLVFSSVTVVKPDHGSTNFTQKTDSIVYTAPTSSADRTPTTDTLDVVISDGKDGNVPGQISILIIDNTPLPAAAPLTHELTRTVPIDEDALFDVPSELREQNNGAALNLTGVSVVTTGGGTATFSGSIAVLHPTAVGTFVVNYTVTNASGGTAATDKITLTVTAPPPANPPVAVDDTMTIDSGGTNSKDLLANDTGISDPGDVPAVTLVNRPPANFGSVQLINSVLTFVAAPGGDGQAKIQYSLTDGTGPASVATVTLNILPCSLSLPHARAATVFTPYMTPININLQDYVDSGNIVPGSISGAGLTGITGTYTPPPGMNSTETITYIVENGCHQTFQGELTIDVNRAPVGGTATRALARGGDVSVPITEFASDDEQLRILPLDGSAPSWVGVSGDQTSIIGTVPTSNIASGPYAFNVVVQDPGGLTATAMVTITVANQAPTAIADNYETAITDTFFTVVDALANDTDSEPGDLQIQTASIISGPASQLTFTTNSITVLIGHGVTTLGYTIRDQGGLTSSSTITITSNRPPTIDPASTSVNGQPTAHMPLIAADPDGDDIDITCAMPPGFSYTILLNPDPSPNRYELVVFLPDNFNQPGNNPVTFPCTVTDSFGSFATAPVTITVE